MSAIRRAAIHKLATAAYEMSLNTMTGVVSQDENGRWTIGNHNFETWLALHKEEEIVVVLGSLAEERPVEMRTCRTCGRDYTELECPHCRANRIRLRGS